MSASSVRAVAIVVLFGLLAWPVAHFFSTTAGWIVFCAGFMAQIVFNLRYFARLDRWSRQPVADPYLEGQGAWDGLFSRLYRHEKELHAEITRLDERIAMLLDAVQALTDGVVLLDDNHRIVYGNGTAEAQLGLKFAADRGQPIVNIVRQPEFVTYLGAGDFSQPLALRVEHPASRVLSIHLIPYAGKRRLMMQIKDITQIEQLDRTRRDFVANVSHELRTPLTVLSGFLETLLELELDATEQKRYLELMAGQSKRMQSIVQDLLTLSAIESAPPPADAVVDMESLLEKLQHDAEALSEGRHRLVFVSEGDRPLRGSESELASAFGNLIANAVRYTPAGGSVRVSWTVSAQGAEFAVEDSGIGIDRAHLPRLTERFYRVDRGRSREAGGTGLGLAIAKHALNRHQARLDIRSVLGQGSRFAALFPPERVVTGS